MVEVTKLVKMYRGYKNFFDKEEITKANEEIRKLGGNVLIRQMSDDSGDGETLGFEVVEI